MFETVVVAASDWARAMGYVVAEFEVAVEAAFGFLGLVLGVVVGISVIRRLAKAE
jgi:hypothetical protein